MDELGNWIVKLERRRDGKKYYFRHDGCTTARMESSMRLTKDVAQQLARAISTQHKDFRARAIQFHARGNRDKTHSSPLWVSINCKDFFLRKCGKQPQNREQNHDNKKCISSNKIKGETRIGIGRSGGI